MRIYELAKELGIGSKDLLAVLPQLDLSAKNHMGSLDAAGVLKVRRYFEELNAPQPEPAPEPAPVSKKEKPAEKPKASEAAPVVIKEARPEELVSADELTAIKQEEKPAGPVIEDGVVKVVEAPSPFSKRRQERRGRLEQAQESAVQKIKVTDSITVSELSEKMKVPSAVIIKKLIGLGIMASLNQRIDADVAEAVAAEYGFEIEKADLYGTDILEAAEKEVSESELHPRPPVVTVMGHVDHGKTKLLDAVREADVVSGEAGGITQHIGAYFVHVNDQIITFLDTPGHEAFTAMRARGAQVTDLVILVVAADDGVKPQTVEAINHAKAAGVPIIVAVNKIDLPAADPQRIRQQLAEYDLLAEDWGGSVGFVEISAKQRINIDGLLERVLLESEILELKAAPDRPASGTVVEAQLDRAKGPVATILVEEGTLRVGDVFVCGLHSGRVRALLDHHGLPMKEAGPAIPTLVLGFSGVPLAGDKFNVVEDEKTARHIASQRQIIKREEEMRKNTRVTLEDLHRRVVGEKTKDFPVVVKADVAGSIEAIRDILERLSSEKVRLRVIHGGIGAINEADVNLAAASNAILIGFHVRPMPQAEELAKLEEVEIRLYNVIYHIAEEIKAAMEGVLDPTVHEKTVGRVEVRDTFKISKVGMIAGCYVTDGYVKRSSGVRLVRDGVVIFEGKISSLKRFKEDTGEVSSGFECGISLERFNDIKVGDVLEAYEMESVKQTL